MFYDRNLEFKHKETTQSNDMPAKILKSKDNIFAPHICDIFNRCINASQFSSILKPADTNLGLKMELFIEKFLSIYQCGFEMCFDAQEFLLNMLEK